MKRPFCQLEKLSGGASRLTDGLDPLSRLAQRFPAKGYESEKLKSYSTINTSITHDLLFFICGNFSACHIYSMNPNELCSFS